jgi:hypothetical protein
MDVLRAFVDERSILRPAVLLLACTGERDNARTTVRVREHRSDSVDAVASREPPRCALVEHRGR